MKKKYMGRTLGESIKEELKDPEFAAAWLSESLKDREPGHQDRLVEALRGVAEAHGIAALTGAIGLSPKALYWSLKKGRSPSLETFLAILDYMGIELQPRARKVKASRTKKRAA